MKIWTDGSTTYVKIYTDGSYTETCFIIEGQEAVRQPASDIQGKVTGNQSEYYALIRALQEARRQGIRSVVVYSDSQLMIRQLTRNPNESMQFIYETKNPRLRDLRRIVLALSKFFDSVKFCWIPRKKNPAGLELERKI